MSDAPDQSAPSGVGTLPPVDFVALSAGRTIGRYEIVSILGQGGFGITYRAHDSQLDREVAIKEYLPLALAVRQDGTTVLPRSTDAAADFAWGRERFVAEGRTLASLQNAPAIVRVFDFLEANGTAYIVMQLLSGETLEHRLKQKGPLAPAEIDRILWPLLDGLEQVHATGFLHRDIKPANILLDDAGNPTLIDFGASRAAMAGRTTALTAIFTPGYAAAEQMTSAKQGPWTDIYGLSATLYHAITGKTPPGAFDRMLDDTYEPLGQMTLPGFSPGLLVGLDAGLGLRASDRPQAIAGWRPILGQATAHEAHATVAMGRQGDGATVLASRPTVATGPAASPKRRVGLWVGAAAVAVLLLGSGYYALVDDRSPASEAAAVTAAPPVDKAAQAAQAAAEARRRQDQEELTKLRADAAAREKAAADEAERRRIEEETRRTVEAEFAEKKRLEDEARQAAEAEATARRKAEDDERKAAETAEGALRLTTIDRQHVQVALTALGFATGGTDGSFGARTREMIAAWQKARGLPQTGFLSGTQNQALLKEAAPAVSRFDDDLKKAEDAKRKAIEEKAKAEAASRSAATPAPPPANVAAAAPMSGPDGAWRGMMQCSPSNLAGPFRIPLQIAVAGGSGTWTRPGSGVGIPGNQSVSIRFSGASVIVSRTFVPRNQPTVTQVATMTARFDGNAVSGSGPEQNGGGRSCTISLTRSP
jgi:serine/threonine protein kinase/peptidoglycan hydrolase-like protein with peptidoglycan-binding domain